MWLSNQTQAGGSRIEKSSDVHVSFISALGTRFGWQNSYLTSVSRPHSDLVQAPDIPKGSVTSLGIFRMKSDSEEMPTIGGRFHVTYNPKDGLRPNNQLLKLEAPDFFPGQQNLSYEENSVRFTEGSIGNTTLGFHVYYSVDFNGIAAHCCRTKSTTITETRIEYNIGNDDRRELYHRRKEVTSDEDDEKMYVVVGIRSSSYSIPKERLLRVDSDKLLFDKIRRVVKVLRPFHHRLFSLKKVSGFGIYQCFPDIGDHATVQLDPETKRTLSLLFAAYNTSPNRHRRWKGGRADRWTRWIHGEFNSSSKDPHQGNYALELRLDWSAPRFMFWGVSPIVLSLVIGLWYMLKPLEEGADYIAVVQTGWTIASYIVTAAAVLLGVLAAITQFGDV